jgi:ribulose-phosphate 3-epimerase
MSLFVSASILSADFAHLAQETQAVIEAGADMIHFDVMDHHFVPNLSFGAVVCAALRKAGLTAPIDVHLMVDNPDPYIDVFAKAGANLITFHAETSVNLKNTLAKIADCGMKKGLAINPDKPLPTDLELIRDLDMILIMSVFPGFGGQAFIESSIEKIQEARQLISAAGSSTLLGVDGGIKVDNIGKVAAAGADFFVVGSGLYGTSDYHKTILQLRQEIQAR